MPDEQTPARGGRDLEPTDPGATVLGTAPNRPESPGETPESQSGRRVGPYRIERLIAHGGMGAVYLAQREDDFRQRVALKLIRPEKANLDILRRFYAERQILAGLEHPGIARIFDGGSTADELPYFVMEYVEGERIDLVCDRLPLRRRLALFQDVCAAVQAAHQNLVAHRDLKPSNILVTRTGHCKLLDFGIAKILDAEREGPDTGHGMGPMTLAYASPEQINGDTLTTATDIYSLGVLLYRLLSGRLPYDIPPGAPGIATLRMLCEQDPVAPSRVAPPGDARRIAGELDAITLRAMRKKPADRYVTAAQLAEEIRRHLDHLPVEAHRGSWWHRAGKTARRHKGALAALLALLVFAASVTGLWRHAVEQQRVAERSQARAERVTLFLEELFVSADPDQARGRELSLREALDQGREKLTVELGEEPELRADLLGVLGTVYNNLGHHGETLALKTEAVRLRRAHLADDTEGRDALATDLNNLGRIHYDLGDYARAAESFREALELWQGLGDRERELLALRNLAAALDHQGDTARALTLYEQNLTLARQLFADHDPRLASSLHGLGALYRRRGEAGKAIPLLREVLDIYDQNGDTRPSRLASVESSLALTLHALGRPEDARPYLEKALATRSRLFGEHDARVASTEKNLAAVLIDLGELDTARRLLDKSRATFDQVEAPAAWAADADSLWGSYLLVTGRYEQAEPFLVESLEALRALEGEDALLTRAAHARLQTLEALRRDQEETAESDSAASSRDDGRRAAPPSH